MRAQSLHDVSHHTSLGSEGDAKSTRGDLIGKPLGQQPEKFTFLRCEDTPRVPRLVTEGDGRFPHLLEQSYQRCEDTWDRDLNGA
jgi:hypothetical protein